MKNRPRRMSMATVVAVLLAASWASAATAPDNVNYQGVLRDAAGVPIDGNRDMVFHFYSAEVGGNQILIDFHDAAHGNPVAISEGLFNVALGGGVVTDGSGPGTYLSLSDVFRDHSSVWLTTVVGTETLSPRTKILSAAYAFNSDHLGGNDAAFFIDTSTATQTKGGSLVIDTAASGATAIEGHARGMGGLFADSDSTGYVELGIGNYGLKSRGSLMGGYFQDTNQSGYANVARADFGIQAYGNTAGGYFEDLNNSSWAYVGHGYYGLSAYGSSGGGYFENTGGSSEARIAVPGTGIVGKGTTRGGEFRSTNSSGYAFVGTSNVGIHASGSGWGGRFVDSDGSGNTYVAYGDYGIRGFGDTAGAYFEDSNSSGNSEIGTGNYGIKSFGDTMGGYFNDTNSSAYAYVGYGSYKIFGSGTVSFVQNHPYEKDKVIVYAAPEGGESATYTRGKGRLVAGEARVPLEKTFAWVTNPDIGLTAHITPRDECGGLYIAALSSTELVVREIDGGSGNVAFDYLVYGLRIGFEELGVVQEKQQEAYIPSMSDHREAYSRRPELREYNALERFKAMRVKAGSTDGPPDFSAANALREAIVEFNPAVHELSLAQQADADNKDIGLSEAAATRGGEVVSANEEGVIAPDRLIADPAIGTTAGAKDLLAEGFAAGTLALMPTRERLEAGDLLVFDPEQPGALRRGTIAGDRALVGIALGDSYLTPDGADEAELQVRLAIGGIVLAKVDAGYGQIRVGDLLVASPTPGHAMVSLDPLPGTILGKAAEAQELGTGLIKVIVMLR